MRVIASIENPTVIRRILEHLGLWLANARAEGTALHSNYGLSCRADPVRSARRQTAWG